MIGIIRAFAGHRIAPNLLMFIMLASGLLVASRIETRFFPEFSTQLIIITVPWRSAAAEDVDNSLITPLSKELRNISNLKKISSYAVDGLGSIYLEFPEKANISEILEDVKRYVDISQSKLPADSDTPEVRAAEFNVEITRLAISGLELSELRPLARRLEGELTDLDIGRVDVSGIPKDDIQIILNQRQLNELGLNIRDVGRQISQQNKDISAGNISGGGRKRLLRTLSKRQDFSGIIDMEILDGNGNVLRLGDFAQIRRFSPDNEPVIYINGKPAVEFKITQKSGGDALAAAEVIGDWVEKTSAILPPSVEINTYYERWRAIESRLKLLFKNGMQGMIFVVLLLFLFLNGRVAFWVAAGIPATFMVAFFTLFMVGGSLNMLSMFAFIMTTGIVVDDAVVVGENAIYRLQRGEKPLPAAVNGAKEMFVAVLASTMTTLCSFMPLFLIGGPIGAILFEIPLVVICVLLASLFECFLVLPGHLWGAFSVIKKQKPNPVRQRLEGGLIYFQEKIFRRAVTVAVRYRGATLATSLALLVFSVSLFIGGAVKYRFFPGAELDYVWAEVSFISGTPKKTVEEFSQHLAVALKRTEAAFPDDENILRHQISYFGVGGLNEDGSPPQSGQEKLLVMAELKPTDKRLTKTTDFAQKWRSFITEPASLENLNIKEESAGPPGEDMKIRLSNNSVETLKAASLELQQQLRSITGLSSPRDDLPYGKEQAVFSLTPLGRSLGLTVEDIAAQLRDAFDGYFVQTFYEGLDEVDFRVLLDEEQPDDFLSFQVRLPNGSYATLQDIATIKSRRGFDAIQRITARPVVHVIADVDFAVADLKAAQKLVLETVLPDLAEKYDVSYSFAGANVDEQETVADMKIGLIVAAVLVYVILAAVFASWTLPVVVILTAPLAVIGAIWGHGIMGYEMTILSAFGVFTLNGIVVNDAIVLVRDYMTRRAADSKSAADNLIVDTACRRFRAVLLTSLTTISGLSPLMFETSTQAQFLIPMAISICFGLAFATLLVLFITPAYLSYHESAAKFFGRRQMVHEVC